MPLDVKELRMYYDTPVGELKAVDSVSFKLNKGEALGIAGESGCGKSSLGLTIMRLLPPNGRILGGAVRLNGENLLEKTEKEMCTIRWKRLSMVFQGAMNALTPVLRVGDQIAEAIRAHENMGKEEARRQSRKMLSLVGLEEARAESYPHELSGGMRQRAMIAMALACNPELLIADEPTTALDVVVQAQVLDLLRDLRAKLGLSLMLISHDVSIVAQVCDLMAVMYAGNFVEYSDTREIFQNPLHPYTRRLMAAVPSVKGGRTRLTSILGLPPDLANLPAGCRFNERCVVAEEMCKTEEPVLTEVRKKHFVACHLVK